MQSVHILRRIARRAAAGALAGGVVASSLTLASAPTRGQTPSSVAPASRAATAAVEPRVDSTPLRLAALYEKAAQLNPRLEAARALARAADARVPGTQRLPDPQLQLGLMNRSLPSLAPMDPLGMTQLQVMQMVPIAGKLPLAGNVASARADAARERADDVRWEVRSRVAMAFYDLYRTDRSLEVADGTRRLLENVARTAQ
ncbi:MAG TPA: TolC family protein, partial [Gemmatimonadaceae bacterium]|nr:TolC family protein [Gemmatimonadaceae bacterium]